MTRRVKIPNDVYTEMCKLKADRDRTALKIGVALLEFEKLKAGWTMDIQRSLHEEQQLCERALKKMGIDPELRVRADYDTGEFLL